MRFAFAAACAAFFLSAALAQAAAPRPAASGNNGDLLFGQGLFDQARSAYEAVPLSNPHYEDALRQLGVIALYQNHLAEAEAKLQEARSRNPADMQALAHLAETKLREGKFADAVTILRQLHNPRVAEFALFGDATPYRIAAHQGGAVTLPLQFTEPLPVVLAKVNGLPGLFVIDTGAPEIIVDPQFALAARVDIAQLPGAQPGQGRRLLPFGRIRKFALTGLETDDVPAMLVSTAGFSRFARGKRIAGVIGTEFLSHFRPTIDYVHDRLALEPHDAPVRTGGTIAEIPFWFAGDHILVAPGRLDKGPKQLFFINTGMADAVFVAPDSTLRDAGVPVPTLPAAKAGSLPSATFPIAQLALGNLVESKLTGAYGLFPPPLERGFGFHVGGIVAHGFFHTYTVTFDFVRMRIDIRK